MVALTQLLSYVGVALISMVSFCIFNNLAGNGIGSEHCTKVRVSGQQPGCALQKAQLRVCPMCCGAKTGSLKCTQCLTVQPMQTSYARARSIPGSIPLADITSAQQAEATHMFLLTRHGTRWPTKKRLKQVDELAPFLQPVSTAARSVQTTYTKASQHALLCTECSAAGSPWLGDSIPLRRADSRTAT